MSARRCVRVACGGALIVWLIASGLAHAQEVVTLSVAEAVARGVEASHRLGELDARRAGSEAAVAGARAAELPQVAVLAGYTRTNHVDEFGIALPGAPPRIIYPDIPDNWRSRVDVQWPLYSSGRLQALARAARADAVAASHDAGAARTDVRLDVARAYWSLVTARDAVRVVEAALQRVEAHVADARARFETGLVPPNEVSSAEAQRSLQRALLIESRNQERLAQLALARLVGLEPDARIEPSEPLTGGPALAGDPAALVLQAREARGDRRALSARVEAAEARRAGIRGSHVPPGSGRPPSPRGPG